VLGIDPLDAVDVELGSAGEGVLESLREAVSGHHQVEIDYYAYGRDQRTRRVVDPHRVFTAGGQWYLEAYCHLAEADRRFRIDRVRALTPLDRRFDPHPAPVEPGVYSPRDSDPRVVLELEARARWVTEQYPLESLEELDGGRCRVTLVVSERAFLERLLLRLGPAAAVVEGADGVVGAAAARVLGRYRRPLSSCGP
jgi:proteasome accessory factor C